MLALRAARVFDGSEMLDGRVVLVGGSSIAGVADVVPAGADVVDLGGATLLPGLVDSHVHLAFDGSSQVVDRLISASDSVLLDRMRAAASANLAAGVTTVRDLGDRGYLALRLRGLAPTEGPHVLAAGPPVTVPRGHCWYLGGEATGVAGLRAAVRERVSRGVDVVKVMASGGELTPGTRSWQPQYTVDELRSLVDEAHSSGLPVTAHAHATSAISRSVAAGVDSIEHCSFFSEDGVDAGEAVIDRIRAAGTVVSFTGGLVPGLGPPLPGVAARLPAIHAALRRLRDAGVPLVCSSDAGISPPKPHGLLPYSVGSFVDCGIAPVAALRAVTSTAAALCGLAGRKGWVAAEHDADLLAVAGDPTADPSALLDVVAVYRLGVRVR